MRSALPICMPDVPDRRSIRPMQRRTFMNSAAFLLLGLSGCDGGGETSAPATTPPPPPDPVAEAAPTTAPAPSTTPATAPTTAPSTLFWQLEGDSYMLAMTTWSIVAGLKEEIVQNSTGGSTFQMIRDRVVAKPELRSNPLLIWDGAANGHVVGSLEMEVKLLAEIAAFKAPYKNWILVTPVVVFQGTGLPPVDEPMVRDMKAWRDRVIADHGEVHVFDPLPTLQSFSNGSPEDAADVAAGMMPRSVAFDGLHPDERAKRAVGDALTASNGPMARVRHI